MVEVLQESMVERARLDRLSRTSGCQITPQALGGAPHATGPPPSIADVLAACGAALVEATPAVDFTALCATSKRTATVTDPTVLKALEEQLPELGSESVKRRLAAAPHPLRVLTSMAQLGRHRAGGDDVASNPGYEVVCEVTLANGRKFVQRGPFSYVHKWEALSVEEVYTEMGLAISGANHEMVISETAIDYTDITDDTMLYKAIRPEEDHFLAERSVWTDEDRAVARTIWTVEDEWQDLWTRSVGRARISLVRDDGKCLLLYNASLPHALRDHPLEYYTGDMSKRLVGYEIAVRPEIRQLVSSYSMVKLTCHAIICTNNTNCAPVPLPGVYRDKRGGLCQTHFGVCAEHVEMNIKGFGVDNAKDLIKYLNCVGDWR